MEARRLDTKVPCSVPNYYVLIPWHKIIVLEDFAQRRNALGFVYGDLKGFEKLGRPLLSRENGQCISMGFGSDN